MRSWKLLWSSLIVLTLALAPKHRLATGAEENADFLPRLGETTSEYEARTRGLTRPSAPIVAVFGDARCRLAGALLGRADR